MKIHHTTIKGFLILFLSILALTSAADTKKNSGSNNEFVLVIDAGHGGKDIGASDNNTREKDINLGVAQKLAELVKKNLKDVKVVMTRNSDTYLTLQERADKANRAKGNLFISIHTNSVDKSNKNRTTVAGASVYALGLHKDNNNMQVARRENSVIELEKDFNEKYSGFDPSQDESYIIFEMAQKKNLSQSIKFANQVQKQLVDVAGRRDRGVHQAGFWVLWATSMPSVLVELDFICNPNSATYMASEKGQGQLAQAIFNAVKNYVKNNKKGTTINNSPENDLYDKAETPASSEGAVVLPAAKAPERKQVAISAKTAVPARGTMTKRRRRSDTAKELSMSRDISTTAIPLHTEEERLGKKEVSESQPKSVDQPASPVQIHGKKKGSGKKATEYAKKKEHKGKVEKFITVYKIQILASEEELKPNNPRFCGLSPISRFREGKFYKYTIGESSNRSDLEPLLKEVKTKIPDAYIIKTLKMK